MRTRSPHVIWFRVLQNASGRPVGFLAAPGALNYDQAIIERNIGTPFDEHEASHHAFPTRVMSRSFAFRRFVQWAQHPMQIGLAAPGCIDLRGALAAGWLHHGSRKPGRRSSPLHGSVGAPGPEDNSLVHPLHQRLQALSRQRISITLQRSEAPFAVFVSRRSSI